jgi:mercuric reductase
MSSCCAGNGGNGAFDLAVIGAGSAGFSAAITAAEQGAWVALIGHGTIGGTCVNVGCVPSKTLIRAAESLHNARVAARFAGIRGEARLDDWRALVAQKEELVAGLRQAKYVDLLPAYNTIAYMEAPARLSPEGVHVNGDLLRASRTIVATGASAARPSIPGIDDIDHLTSTSALELEALPRSMLVIGGGYIGCELAQLFARAGVKVTLVTRSRILPEGEPEVSVALAGYLSEEDIDVRTGLSYRQVRRTSSGVALVVEADGTEDVLEAEVMLAATGRRPNTNGLGLVCRRGAASRRRDPGRRLPQDQQLGDLRRRRRHWPPPVCVHGRLRRQARGAQRVERRHPSLRCDGDADGDLFRPAGRLGWPD